MRAVCFALLMAIGMAFMFFALGAWSFGEWALTAFAGIIGLACFYWAGASVIGGAQ
jgi:hypothetical protein